MLCIYFSNAATFIPQNSCRLSVKLSRSKWCVLLRLRSWIFRVYVIRNVGWKVRGTSKTPSSGFNMAAQFFCVVLRLSCNICLVNMLLCCFHAQTTAQCPAISKHYKQQWISPSCFTDLQPECVQLEHDVIPSAEFRLLRSSECTITFNLCAENDPNEWNVDPNPDHS